MKNALRKRILLATGLFALLSASAYGQTTQIRVNIPFDFHAGNAVLPSGEYQVNLDVTANRMVFRQMNGGAAVFVQGRPESTAVSERGAAVFNQYGDTYVLRTVRYAGNSCAYQTGGTKLERELAKNNDRPKVASILAER